MHLPAHYRRILMVNRLRTQIEWIRDVVNFGQRLLCNFGCVPCYTLNKIKLWRQSTRGHPQNQIEGIHHFRLLNCLGKAKILRKCPEKREKKRKILESF